MKPFDVSRETLVQIVDKCQSRVFQDELEFLHQLNP